MLVHPRRNFAGLTAVALLHVALLWFATRPVPNRQTQDERVDTPVSSCATTTESGASPDHAGASRADITETVSRGRASARCASHAITAGTGTVRHA
jgi:hypothetical protein